MARVLDLIWVGWQQIFFGKSEIRLDSPVKKPPDGQITTTTRHTHSGMPAIRKACVNLSISSGRRYKSLIPEMRRVGSSCITCAQISRASSTRPDIAWHATMMRCAPKNLGCCRTAVVAHDEASSLRPARKQAKASPVWVLKIHGSSGLNRSAILNCSIAVSTFPSQS